MVLLKSVPPASARAEFGDEVVLVATSETELRTILYDLETEEPRRKRKAAVELDPELVAAAAERSVRFRTEEPLFEMGAFQAVSRELGARKRPADLLCKKAEASSPVVATATDPRRGKPDSVQLLPLFRCYSTDASECRASIHSQAFGHQDAQLRKQQLSSHPFHRATRLSSRLGRSPPTTRPTPLLLQRSDSYAIHSILVDSGGASYFRRKQQHRQVRTTCASLVPRPCITIALGPGSKDSTTPAIYGTLTSAVTNPALQSPPPPPTATNPNVSPPFSHPSLRAYLRRHATIFSPPCWTLFSRGNLPPSSSASTPFGAPASGPSLLTTLTSQASPRP